MFKTTLKMNKIHTYILLFNMIYSLFNLSTILFFKNTKFLSIMLKTEFYA